MAFTVEASAPVAWVCVQYGVPFLLLLALNASLQHEFSYRFWRLQIWLHRVSERFRPAGAARSSRVGGMSVNAAGFDPQYHYHLGGQLPPRVRLALAPLLAFGVVMLMLMPPMLLLAWAATLYFNQGRMLLAVAVGLMAVVLASLYYAIQYWRSSGWRMTGHILTLLAFSLGCYFLLAFVLSFASDGVSFFGLSVHFLVLNYIIVTELISRVEKQQQLPARTILKADDFVAGGAAGAAGAGATTGPAGLAQGERLGKEQKAAVQRENEKRFFEKFKADHDLLKQVAPHATAAAGAGADDDGISPHPAEADQVDSDEEVPSDGEDERQRERDEEAGTATLINIVGEKMHAPFSSVLRSLIHEQQNASAKHSRLQQVKLYLLSLSVLLAYSLMVYYHRSGPVAAADWDRDGDTDESEQDRARYLGFIVSGVLLLWDTLVFVYAAYCGRVIDDLTKILVLGGSRVALVSFGFQGWFLGVCCMYAAGGAYLSYQIIDRRMPFQAFQLGGRKQVQRFSEFCRTLSNPDHEHAPVDHGNALLAAVSRRASSIGIGEFVLLILTVLFLMALCVSYQTGPPAQSLGTLTSAPWQQWEIGLVVWYAVLLWLLSVWCIRYYMTRSWKLSWQSLLLSAVTQALFTLGAYLLFHRTDSVIILVWMVCGPLFVLALLATYGHCVDVDWRLLRPSHMRNPPNLPFLPALLSCGLQRDDYRMLLNLSLSLAMMVAIGAGITLGLDGSSIGWSITFVLFILVTSLVPLVKYLKTLTLDRIDAVMLSLWLVAHIAFFALQYHVNGASMSDKHAFALWGSCVAYPTLLANTLAYHLFQENGQKLTKGTAQVFAFSFVLLVIVVVISFFTLGTAVGGMILAAVLAAVLVTALAIRWVGGSYTLSRPLRWVAGIAFTAVLVAGVLLGVLLPDDDDGFWAYTGSWALLMLYIAVLAYGDRTRLVGRSGESAGSCFRYSSYLFPVYYFDRRNESNPVRGANLHMALSCVVFGLGFCWCAACMVTTRVDLGLGMSALLLLTFYTFARQRTISANKQLMRLLPFLTEDVVRRSKDTAREVQLSGVGMLFDDPQPPVFGLARWGLILSEMLTVNLDPQPVLKRKQNALKRKLGLGRSCFCTILPTSAQQLDDHTLLLERLNDWSAACAKVSFKIEAHFYFLLQSNARAAAATQESTMKSFCAWLKREKRTPPPALQPVEIDPCVSNYDIYDAPTHWSQRRILRMQQWKEEYIESLAVAQRNNEVNRAKEEAAELMRAKRMEEREKLREARARQREAEEKAEEEAAEAAGVSLRPPAIPPGGADPASAAAAAQSPEEKQFWRIVAEHARTGVQWEDPDFPASDDSLYESGERDPSRGAMNQVAIDAWMRPGELLATLAADDPSQRIDTTPRLFVDGFDLSDIEQGFIGDCYFLSAIGCLGVREQATPRYPLLTNIFTMQSPGAEYNSCGAWLVRFYRSGVRVHVLIDDRLPTSQGNFAFSRSKMRNEMWVALLEKAYAKLFGNYESIEAGSISQALCDLSNGASEPLALKGADGTVCVNPDALWVQLEDSFKSGYLIGAGSNTGMDTSWVNGIAQGHAYMVVRCFTDAKQTEKLIQLQNPHGHGEWDGDWSDSSDKWTQWWRATLLEKEEDDGRFWMSFNDFLQSYQNIYICRLLPHRVGIASRWWGHTAAGPSAPFHNPTFVVRAAQPCKVWIELEQRNQRGRKQVELTPEQEEEERARGVFTAEQQAKVSTNGYAFIMFCVLENGGQRVQKLTKDNVKFCANQWKMLNDRQIGAEVFLDSPDTPYTIVAMTKHKGWETDFTLSVFANDEGVKFEMLPDLPPPTA